MTSGELTIKALAVLRSALLANEISSLVLGEARNDISLVWARGTLIHTTSTCHTFPRVQRPH